MEEKINKRNMVGRAVWKADYPYEKILSKGEGKDEIIHQLASSRNLTFNFCFSILGNLILCSIS